MTISIDVLNPVKWTFQKTVGAFAAITVEPLFDLANYIYPTIGAFFSGKSEILERGGNSGPNKIVPLQVAKALHEEIRNLTECAELKGSTRLYTNLNAQYEGNGSFLGRVLVAPLEDIHNKNFDSIIKEERLLSNDELDKHKHSFTDNEIRFQFARAIGKMSGYSVLKIAARIAIVAFAVSLFFTPVGWGSLAVFLGSALLYCVVDRIIEEGADKRGVKILAKRFEKDGFSPEEAHIYAHNTAINCLKKIALQNIEKRDSGKFARLLITPKGGARFDPRTPKPAVRIKRLESSLTKLINCIPEIHGIILAPCNYLGSPPAAEPTKNPIGSEIPDASSSGASAQ
jgi:hypothetical protein